MTAGSRSALGFAYVGNVASLDDFRRAPVEHGLRVFRQCCIDARNVLKQARIDLVDEPAQVKSKTASNWLSFQVYLVVSQFNINTTTSNPR
jgi:hypothetical protein